MRHVLVAAFQSGAMSTAPHGGHAHRPRSKTAGRSRRAIGARRRSRA